MFVTDEKTDNSNYEMQNIVKRSSELDKFYSDKRLGSFLENGNTVFRLFAPSAVKVNLCIFEEPEEQNGIEYFLVRDEDGVWEKIVEGNLSGKFYGYKIIHKEEKQRDFNKPLCIDPYSKAITTKTTYMNPRKSIVVAEQEYDWEGTSWIKRDWRDLIIYEMHIRDITAHKSSGAVNHGSYKGVIEQNITGGINYIKKLGVNTVEILPSQEFGYCEVPYRDSFAGRFNTWNPYERNHWGYMTASYFSPAAYYNEVWKHFKWNHWIGTDCKQINNFKDMVKAFHKNGIAVIMDVVFNHVSEYELGNLKEIDKEYYLRLDEKGNLLSHSWCGNDLKTERPMVRRLIVESLLYWMQEYHIDGFRFDLATLIDWDTVDNIYTETKKINPDVVLIAEAWGGGGYSPDEYSKHKFAAWNDHFRNRIKGENPHDNLGWIFGKWQGNSQLESMENFVNGSLESNSEGLFQKKEHSVNYLESHDGYTFGDFIRIGSHEFDPFKEIKHLDKHIALTPYQLKLNKLGALFLLTSQGIAMISEGQEFARSKVIYRQLGIHDNDKGRIDHDSYNKDNETNYIDYKHAEINKELVEYYTGLIELRKNYNAFRRAESGDINFYQHPDNDFGFYYVLKHNNEIFTVIFNADQINFLDFELPDGTWEVLTDKNTAGIKPLYEACNKVNLEPVTGMVLKLK